jgi:hypothetical protein
MLSIHNPLRNSPAPEPGAPPENPQAYWREGEELSFSDLVDTLNPLQHIPIVSMIYREMTGNSLSAGARIFGGALYGGPVGLVSGVVGAVLEQETGKDMGEHVMAMFKPEEEAPADTMLASVPAAEEQRMAEYDETLPWLVANAPEPMNIENAPVTNVSAVPLPTASAANSNQWQNLAARVPEQRIESLSAFQRSEKAEILPWLEEDGPIASSAQASTQALAPLPLIVTPVVLPSQLPERESALPRYAPYPLVQPVSASAVLDIEG